MATKNNLPPAKKKAPTSGHSRREYLEILIKYTDIALQGAHEDNGWLNYQSKRLKKELKSLK